jgi:small multidrug resistance pump
MTMTQPTLTPKSNRWMAKLLLAAAAYNIVWGATVILFPLLPFRLFEMEVPRYPEIWQCVGMIVGVYGVGYAIAAMDPLRHWPIVLVGLLGKVLGPIGFSWSVVQGTLPLSFGWIIVFNDLIWWVPFGIILWCAADREGFKVVGQISRASAERVQS